MDTGPQEPGSMDETPAIQAAAMLPRTRVQTSHSAAREQLVWSVVGLATFVIMVIGGLIFMFVMPWGWLMLIIGLLVWLLIRFTFFRMPGSETGVVTVDRSGTIHLVTGQTSVRRLQSLFARGAKGQLRAGVGIGILFTVVPLGLVVALCLILDTPLPALALMGSGIWAMIDFLRFFCVSTILPRRRHWEKLNSGLLLPMLAVYARHHSMEDVRSGVPADQLKATLDAHPQDREVAIDYAQRAHALRVNMGYEE